MSCWVTSKNFLISIFQFFVILNLFVILHLYIYIYIYIYIHTLSITKFTCIYFPFIFGDVLWKIESFVGGSRDFLREGFGSSGQDCVRPKAISRFNLNAQTDRCMKSKHRELCSNRTHLISQPVCFDGTITLIFACTHVVGVEVLIC